MYILHYVTHDTGGLVYLGAALSVRVTLKDVSHHGNVTFLHCPVEGSLSILM